MSTSDILGLILFSSFGVWFVAAPQSLISFYKFFHRGHFVPPKVIGVRVVGVLWIALVVGITLFTKH